jgi:UDP-N-acetylglucosamine/UDP-N-acetylgalactosamine diphosphorylase
MTDCPNNIIEFLKKYNQEHLLMFWDDLDASQKYALISQINSIDFEEIHNLYLNSKKDDSIDSNDISPLPYISKKALSDDDLNFYTDIGENIIRKR